MNLANKQELKTNRHRFIFAGTVAILLVLVLNPGWALSGDEVLAKMETTLSAPDDSESTAQMVVSNSDGSQREERSLKTWMAGKDKRVIKFLSPAGIEGLGLLSLGENEMYLYLPAQNKIRRIEGGSKNEEFQGTDFSYSEMGSYEYKKDYQAVLTAEDAGNYTLSLTKKAGVDRPYDKLIMIIAKENYMPQIIEFYEKNVLKKRLSFLEVQSIEQYYIPVKIKMENLIKKHYTELVLSNIKVNKKLGKQDVFSKRFLKQRVRE